MPVTLSLLVLKTHDIEKLRHFYSMLGIEFVQEQHGKGPVHFSATLGETVLEIYPLARDATVDTTTRIGLVVGDLNAVLESMSAVELYAATPAWQTEWGLRTVVKDPDGRSVELYQRPK